MAAHSARAACTDGISLTSAGAAYLGARVALVERERADTAEAELARLRAQLGGITGSTET